MAYLIKTLVVLIALWVHGGAYAQSLSLLTEEDSPYNFQTPDGKPAGLTVELVQEIQRRLRSSEPIQFVPWARAYNTGLREPNTVVFTMARTNERNGLFHWVGPVNENAWVFVGRTPSTVRLNRLSDAKVLPRIGVYRADSRDQFLTQQGFTNLERANTNVQILKMLMAGRVDAVAMADVTVQDALKEAGMPAGAVQELLAFKTVQVYIAISRATPSDTVERWQAAFAAMQADGTFKSIYAKHFPKRRLPGPAVDPE